MENARAAAGMAPCKHAAPTDEQNVVTATTEVPMAGRFRGMNAVVTGASRGIGAATAERLAAEGANVAIVARSPEAAAAQPYIVGVDGQALQPAGTLDDVEGRI